MESVRRFAASLSPTSRLCLFLAINFLNYLDRGVVPGSFSDIQALIRSDTSIGSSRTTSTATWLGLLQSAFIVGYSISSLVCGFLAVKVKGGPLVAGGLLVWVIAVILSSAAGSLHSGGYWVLLIARCLSGVGEAAFQVVVPPWLEDAAGDRRGLWLSVLYGAIPVGTAFGYIAGGAFHDAWRAVFLVEGLLVAVLLPLVYALPLGTASGGSGGDSDAPAPPLWRQVTAALADPVYASTALGYAGLTAVLSGLGSFGPLILQGLDFTPCQSSASFTFGACVSVAGLLGTPAGGLLLDRIIARQVTAHLALHGESGAGEKSGAEMDEHGSGLQQELATPPLFAASGGDGRSVGVGAAATGAAPLLTHREGASGGARGEALSPPVTSAGGAAPAAAGGIPFSPPPLQAVASSCAPACGCPRCWPAWAAWLRPPRSPWRAAGWLPLCSQSRWEPRSSSPPLRPSTWRSWPPAPQRAGLWPSACLPSSCTQRGIHPRPPSSARWRMPGAPCRRRPPAARVHLMAATAPPALATTRGS